MTEVLARAVDVTRRYGASVALDHVDLTDDELAEIDQHATDADINLWSRSSSQ